ncbi:type II toxin-antitoxin system RelE/ParE family toxin [Caballeronia sp. LZ065]|uniref:type II toxin-antitoxin system RelE/ParE family toxin n=1 Tax=Caballeronia sp. LZ065 TaxID=3038571 RepID=UPI00285EA1ED|nr:type II toxin-antitoxin system RelE/ParE family toxin [Caballeronia sp. LZ065]MDR5783429.1 type II toxin-antitoxin system RelE/ParE family toxin [Caballeronia sp. LZ065]
MTLQVVWTQAARLDLKEIIQYIAERSPAAARIIKGLIEAAPESAAQAPYLYRTGRVSGTREIVAHPDFILVYAVKEHIETLNVLHSRQSYPFL